MRQIYSLPQPEQFGFRWRPFEKARKKLDRVQEKRKEVQRREAALKARMKAEKQDDVKRLATAILDGSAADESTPGSLELEDMAAEMRELQRLSEALKQAEVQAEADLLRTVQAHREQWIPEVDDAVVRALGEEREAFRKAMELADAARSRRQRLETLQAWVRTTPSSFSPPADVSVRSAFDRLASDTNQAERLLHERAANEQLARESEEGGAA
jgi:hypothetical protein